MTGAEFNTKKNIHFVNVKSDDLNQSLEESHETYQK